jgi:hypothetical protein
VREGLILHFLSEIDVDFAGSCIYFVVQSQGRGSFPLVSVPSKPIRQSFRAHDGWMSPLAVAGMGVLGLWMADIHALFGLSLALFVIVAFHVRVRDLPRNAGAEIRRVTRHLSRTVYLLLGALAVYRALTRPEAHDLHDYFVDALASLILIRLMAYAHTRPKRSAQP